MPADAVYTWAYAACQRLNPDFKRIAKSPTSCGISWTIIINETIISNIL